jgi:predicted RNase H-like HicB family nuclease
MASYIALLRKDDNSDYGVEFPDLPGCISAGGTLEEAHRMAEEALAAHVAFLREGGDDVLAPSPLDVIARQPEIKGAVCFMVELK